MNTRLEAHFGDRVVRCFAERPRGLHELLLQAIQKNKDGEALVCNGQRLTYAALEERVGRVAQGFVDRGIEAGERVALLLGNRPEFVVALLAAARIGAIAVPLNIREQKPELAYVLGHCGAALLIYEAHLEERLPPVEQRICISDFPSLYLEGSADPVETPEERTAAILYTSGTTGRPKGAMLSHLGIVHSAMHFEQHMQLAPGDRSIAAVPLSHVTGLVALIAAMLRCAGTLVVMPEFKAAEFLRLAARECIAHTVMVPAM